MGSHSVTCYPAEVILPTLPWHSPVSFCRPVEGGRLYNAQRYGTIMEPLRSVTEHFRALWDITEALRIVTGALRSRYGSATEPLRNRHGKYQFCPSLIKFYEFCTSLKCGYGLSGRAGTGNEPQAKCLADRHLGFLCRVSGAPTKHL